MIESGISNSSKKAARVRKAVRHTLFAPLASFPPHPIVGIDTRLIGRGPPRRWVSKRLKKGPGREEARRFDRRRVVDKIRCPIAQRRDGFCHASWARLGFFALFDMCVPIMLVIHYPISIHECPFDDVLDTTWMPTATTTDNTRRCMQYIHPHFISSHTECI